MVPLTDGDADAESSAADMDVTPGSSETSVPEATPDTPDVPGAGAPGAPSDAPGATPEATPDTPDATPEATPEAAPDAAVDADASSSSATSARLDRRLNIAVAAAAVALVGLVAWFGYSVWAQTQSEEAASPAYQVIIALQKQVESKPSDPTLHSRLAEALGAAGRFDEAKQQLAVAIKLDPKYVGAYQNLAMIEVLLKEYASAEKHLNKVLALTGTGDYQNLNERRELAYFHLGEIALLKRRYEDAVGYFKAAIRIRKDASDTYVRLAQAYIGMDLKDQAKKQLDIALKFDPRFAEAHYELGKIRLAEGDKVDAAWEFRAALDGAPDATEPQIALDALGSYDTWYEKAVAAEKAGSLQQALDAVRIARAIQPTSYDAAMLHGTLLERDGDAQSALEAFEIAAKFKPDDKAAAAAVKRAQAEIKKKDAK